MLLTHIGDRGHHDAPVPERGRRAELLREALPVATGRTGSGPPTGPATVAGRSATACSTRCRAIVWAANLAALELHAPMARAADIEAPQMVVFDLDPGRPARAWRSAPRSGCGSGTCSTASGSSAWPRRRGPRGCSSTCRSTRSAHTHEQASSFAHAVAQAIERAHPKLVVTRPDQGAPEGQGAHRLEPEQPAQDDDRRPTASGPGRSRRCRRRSSGTRSRRPPTASRCASRPATCWPGSRSTATSSPTPPRCARTCPG